MHMNFASTLLVPAYRRGKTCSLRILTHFLTTALSRSTDFRSYRIQIPPEQYPGSSTSNSAIEMTLWEGASLSEASKISSVSVIVHIECLLDRELGFANEVSHLMQQVQACAPTHYPTKHGDGTQSIPYDEPIIDGLPPSIFEIKEDISKHQTLTESLLLCAYIDNWFSTILPPFFVIFVVLNFYLIGYGDLTESTSSPEQGRVKLELYDTTRPDTLSTCWQYYYQQGVITNSTDMKTPTCKYTESGQGTAVITVTVGIVSLGLLVFVYWKCVVAFFQKCWNRILR
jgi:hypothetical protein